MPFVLVTCDFVTTGGMDRANYALADYLARDGRPTHLVAHRVEPKLAARPEVRFHKVVKPLGSYLMGSWPLAGSGARIARENPGYRLVANGGNCRSTDVNWVHYVHAAYRPDSAVGLPRRLKAALEQPLNCRAERACLLAAKLVVCNSQRTRADVIRLGVLPDRTRVVYYGTDATLFHPVTASERAALRSKLNWPADRPVVCFIGALGDRRKGFDTQFTAWTELCQSSDWDAVLVVIGRGAELPAWERRCKDAGLTDRLKFLGFRSNVPDLLRAADLLVAPTRYEAYELGVQEALSCGLPAIVSASAGVAERHPGELADLLLPDAENAADLASRLRHWRLHLDSFPSRVAPLSAALRTNTWDVMARNFLYAIGEPL